MKKKMKIIFGSLLSILVIGGISGGWWYYRNYGRNPPTDFGYEQNPNLETTPLTSLVAENVELPWAIDFFPNGDLIFTERPGRVRLIPNGTQGNIQEVAIIDEVNHLGEGGLLGLTLHPLYPEEPYVFLYYTYSEGGKILDKVVRYNYTSQSLIAPFTIIENIPGALWRNRLY